MRYEITCHSDQESPVLPHQKLAECRSHFPVGLEMIGHAGVDQKGVFRHVMLVKAHADGNLSCPACGDDRVRIHRRVAEPKVRFALGHLVSTGGLVALEHHTPGLHAFVAGRIQAHRELDPDGSSNEHDRLENEASVGDESQPEHRRRIISWWDTPLIPGDRLMIVTEAGRQCTTALLASEN